jgi:hypothetical protein
MPPVHTPFGDTPRSNPNAPMARFVLPVSGIAVALRRPTGEEDVQLAEHSPEDPNLALALVERLGQTDSDTDAMRWADLPVPDIDTFIVRLRQAIVGNRVVAEVDCTSPDCGQRVDLSFDIDTYLGHHRPSGARRPALRIEREADGVDWYVPRTADADAVRFRLPTLADQIAVDQRPDAAAALAERCIRPGRLPARQRARVATAMAALAPPLSGALEGHCPHCATPISAWFEARVYCLQELRDRARFVYDDIDALAERYHWSEQAILTLPHVRRTSYVERARMARAG